MDKYLKLLGASRPEFSVVPCSPNDLIQVEAVSSTVPVTLEIEGIALDLNGSLVPFHFDMLISTANTLTTLRPRLGYQALLSLSIITRTSSIPDGACYVRAAVVQSQTRGVFPYRKLLTQGYVSTLSSIGYGSSSIDGAPTKHQHLVNIEFPAASPMSPQDYVVPNFELLEILSIFFTLNDGGGGATPFGFMSIILPPSIPVQFFGITPVAPTSIYEYTFAPNMTDRSDATNLIDYIAIPKLIVTPGTTIRCSSTSFAAGESIASAHMLALRTITPWA